MVKFNQWYFQMDKQAKGLEVVLEEKGIGHRDFTYNSFEDFATQKSI